jgi:hypothetical protein
MGCKLDAGGAEQRAVGLAQAPQAMVARSQYAAQQWVARAEHPPADEQKWPAGEDGQQHAGDAEAQTKQADRAAQ